MQWLEWLLGLVAVGVLVIIVCGAAFEREARRVDDRRFDWHD